MTKAVQFFAYTAPTAPTGQTTPYIQAFKEVSDLITIRVRGKDGAEGAITITPQEAMRLSLALGAAKFTHEVVAARAERGS